MKNTNIAYQAIKNIHEGNPRKAADAIFAHAKRTASNMRKGASNQIVSAALRYYINLKKNNKHKAAAKIMNGIQNHAYRARI